jgi:hypothetical protein
MNSEEIMTTAPAFIVDEVKSKAAELSITENEPLLGAPEISRDAWKVIILFLVGEVLFLAAVGAYVFSGLFRFQNCL